MLNVLQEKRTEKTGETSIKQSQWDFAICWDSWAYHTCASCLCFKITAYHFRVGTVQIQFFGCNCLSIPLLYKCT